MGLGTLTNSKHTQQDNCKRYSIANEANGITRQAIKMNAAIDSSAFQTKRWVTTACFYRSMRWNWMNDIIFRRFNSIQCILVEFDCEILFNIKTGDKYLHRSNWNFKISADVSVSEQGPCWFPFPEIHRTEIISDAFIIS